MPFIDTRREDIRALKGVHLFHFATSNCSQRVRFVLEEKGVEWESHHIDLMKCENATPEFTAINPKGVVPVLVHDGMTIVESNDIIRYVDENFTGPRLTPENHTDAINLQESLKVSSDFQGPLKLLTHEFLFKPFRRMNKQQFQKYSEGTKNQELVDFMREFSSDDGFGRERIMAAVSQAELALGFLETRLEDRDWLTSDHFGLADISWVVNIHRLSHMRYPTSSYPLVANWLARVQGRQAFHDAISCFESRKVLTAFKLYSTIRSLRRSSVQHVVAGMRNF